jgi:hypothetical protein
MKDIKDMTLTECIDRLRELPDGTCQDQFDGYMNDLPWIWDVAEKLANRIDTLLFEQAQRHDAWVDALENKINSLEAKHRWIPVSERMPTEEEHGNEVFRVWVLGGETDACFVSGKIMVWVDSPFEADYEEYDPKRYKTAFTHWKRITPPEDKP